LIAKNTPAKMVIFDVLRQSGETFLTLLYPPHCAICAADLTAGEYLCDTCKTKAGRIRPPFCRKCSQPFDGAIDSEFSCANCGQRHTHFECAVSCYRSRGIVRELLHRFKYQREFHLRHPLAEWMIEALEDLRIAAHRIDFIVPVPLHPTRQRERHFNQAKVMAEMLCKRSGVPLLDCLKRIRKTTTQTRFDRAERMENLRNAFQMRNNKDVQGRQLVLVDDVFTTGSTVDECARVLKNAGAGSVRVVTIARG
jgi:ComF family protein